MRRQFLRQALGLGGVVLGAGVGRAGAAAGAAATLSFGVVPQQAATELARAWIPLLNLIAGRSGLPLRFATAPDIPTFEKRLANGAYDLAYMNPYHYTVFSQRPGYRAVAREKDRRLRGLVVVRQDSPMNGLIDLAGQTLAFPAPAAFAATVLVRAELARRKVPVQARFVGSHNSVYLNVAQGLAPAGGGIQRTLSNMDDQVRQQLRVLWTTEGYTPHAIAAHPRVPAASVAALQAAMLALGADPAAQSALAGLGFQGLVPAQDADWDDVRGLGIATLADLLKG